jgi:hypothetical protein
MKYLLIILLLVTATLHAQQPSLAISVEGRIKNPKTLSLEILKKFTLHTIDSLQIYNHQMIPKSMPRNIKGVLLKEVLKEIEFDAETPTVLSQYYIVCTATDNYKVVFSWNELFNSPAGDKILLVIGKNGMSAEQDKDGIMLVSPSDSATGRRYVKELSKIIIQRVN